MKILMVAAENDALPGGKVGGIGDVVRDIPKALAEQQQRVEVVLPGYGMFSTLASAQKVDTLAVHFAGMTHKVELYQLHNIYAGQNVVQWVLEHPLFSEAGRGQIYCDDPPDSPFASDATKFALFCAAVAKALCNGLFGQVDIIHLHDWHAAMLTVLRAFDPEYAALKAIPTVYTIHNLALQGTRPMAGSPSSLVAWFKDLKVEHNQVIDPRYPNCINPMRCGINLSDKVHVVSDSYAEEVLLPSEPHQGFFGGEGLEMDLQRAKDEGRLVGILNGCEYQQPSQPPCSFDVLNQQIHRDLLLWASRSEFVKSAHMIATARLNLWQQKQWQSPPVIVTSVGRLTTQKVSLLRLPLEDGRSALEHLLDKLEPVGVFILLGSGDKALEAFMTEVSAKRSHFLFLNGFSAALSDSLYQTGDLFVMPSSFEPCGISQMLAMRAGQPCLVHGVGGLNDTVKHLDNGFVFKGDNQLSQAAHLVACFSDAITLKQQQPQLWQSIQAAASTARFYWADAAKAYIERLYRPAISSSGRPLPGR